MFGYKNKPLIILYNSFGKRINNISPLCEDAEFQWVHHTFGTNWRMNEVQTAIGRKLIKKQPVWLSKRMHNARILIDGLKGFYELRLSES